MDEMDKENKKIETDDEDNGSSGKNEEDNYLAVGMCLGMTIGQLLFKNLSVGMGIGMCLGGAIGSSIKQKK